MIAIIAAMSENRIIGRDNRLPWRLRSDMRRFRTLTMGHTVIMGRRTFESIGKPLPGRRNIVLSRDPDFEADGAATAQSLEEGIERAAEEDGAHHGGGDIFIIGGEAIYRAALPVADCMHLTIVHTTIDDGDAFFPDFDPAFWRIIEQEHHEAGEGDDHPCTFQTLLRDSDV